MRGLPSKGKYTGTQSTQSWAGLKTSTRIPAIVVSAGTFVNIYLTPVTPPEVRPVCRFDIPGIATRHPQQSRTRETLRRRWLYL